MADKSETDSDSGKKPKIKLNLFIIGMMSFLGLFFIGLIVSLVMIFKMQSTVAHDEAAAAEPVPVAATDKTPVKPEPVAVKEGAAPAAKEGDEKKGKNDANKPQFYKLRPVMVVNIPAADKSRYLQVDVELMTRNSIALENIETYSPIIRNDLIILFSTQRYEDLMTIEGKEALRKKALETVQKIMKQNTGDPTVEQVLFTNFVSQ